MNPTTNLCRDLTVAELDAATGGNFAYDVGRVIRFLGIDFINGQPAGVGVAVADWYLNSLKN